jgi:hypothetical protein
MEANMREKRWLALYNGLKIAGKKKITYTSAH